MAPHADDLTSVIGEGLSSPINGGATRYFPRPTNGGAAPYFLSMRWRQQRNNAEKEPHRRNNAMQVLDEG